MGSHGQSFSRSDIGVAEAESLAGEIRSWLVDEGVIQKDELTCGHSAIVSVSKFEGGCFLPGDRAASVAAVYSPDSPGFSGVGDSVRILGGVPSFSVYPNGASFVRRCPSCDSEVAGGDDFWNAIAAWLDWREGEDFPAVGCQACGESPTILDWVYEQDISIGLLVITFCDWYSLSESFKREMMSRLGDNARYAAGKM